MNVRTWMILAGIFAAGVGMPMLIAWQLKLGEFAKSPQTVRLALGSSALVAGGRAKLWFAQVDLGPTIEISCKRESALVDLESENSSQEVCGVRVRRLRVDQVFLGEHAVPRVEIEVTWDDR